MAKYVPSGEHLKAVEQMASKGVSHSRMAKALGISYATFRRNLSIFEQYIKSGKEKVDQGAVDQEIALVENALLQRCLPMEVTETVTEKRKVGNGESEVIHMKVIKKTIQPSVTAQIYYLVNRSKGKWVSINYANNEESKGTGITREETLEWMNQATAGKELVN